MNEGMQRSNGERLESMGESTRTRIRELCAYIEAHPDEALTLAALGERAHLSPGHLQRRFKAITGPETVCAGMPFAGAEGITPGR